MTDDEQHQSSAQSSADVQGDRAISSHSDVLTLPDQTAETLATPAREALIVRLYDQDMVSSGWAAQALGMSRREFLDLLGRYGVSEFDETLDVAEEQRRAIAARTIDYLVGVGLLDLLPRQ